MTRIYLDTNVVCCLENNPSDLQKFRTKIQRRGFRIACGSELLFEIANNPDTKEALRQLETVGHLVDWTLLAREPRYLISGEIGFVTMGIGPIPFHTEAEARELFSVVIKRVRAGQIGKIRAWTKEINKGYLRAQRETYTEIEQMPSAVRLDLQSPFPITFASFSKTGLLAAYLHRFAKRLLDWDLSDNEMRIVFNQMNTLPTCMTLLTHLVANFHLRHKLKKRPAKLGDNFDVRHLLSASRSNIFLSNDYELQGLLAVAPTFWPFSAQDLVSFLEKE